MNRTIQRFTASTVFALLTLCLALPAGAAGPNRPGVELPGQVRLNGKFDVAYERVGYSDKIQDGQNALRNYHHFIFLSRDAKDDPYFFTAEIIDLYFYEAGMRFGEHDAPVQGEFRAGKLVLPFGSEPTFHQEYGGLAGFDQELLPVVWSRHGARGTVRTRLGDVGLISDTYLVQGYALEESTAVLNLQTDFSAADNIRGGLGERIGLNWNGLSVWYSLYWNSLGFDRQLVMQAFDVSLWRPTELPVLSDLVLKAGVMRADISGGGAGLDYYHFGDYLELRYYPVDWLYIRGRTGIKTVDNRDGLYLDEGRRDSEDTSNHTVGVTYLRDGWTLSAEHVWRLEEVNEVDNDFLRVRLGYAF